MDKSKFVKTITDKAIEITGMLGLDEKHSHNLIHSANKVAGKLFDAGYSEIDSMGMDAESNSMYIRYTNSKPGLTFDVMIFSNQSLIFRTRREKNMKPARINIATVIERLEKFLKM